MRASIKQFWIHWIFAHNFDRIGRWKIAFDRLPRFSQIGRSQNRGTIITRAITVGGDVRHIRIQLRRLDARHPLTARRLRQILRQLRPLAAFIFCHPQPPVICPRPQQAHAFRRFGQGKHSAVIFCAAPRGNCMSRFVARQIGTDHRIFFHAISQQEDAVSAQINHARFMPAHDHRRIPVEAITRLSLRRFGTQTPYLAILQIDPVHFALLTFGVKGVVVRGIEQHIKTVTTRERNPVTIANPFFALHRAGSHPILIVLKAARYSEIRLSIVERDSIKFARRNFVQVIPIFSAGKALINTAIGSKQHTLANLRLWRFAFVFRLGRFRRRHCAGLDRKRVIVGMSFFS